MTTIEWTDKTWNPVTGCTKVSAGCKHCYANAIADRFWGERKFTDVRCHEDRLDVPLRWRKPSRVFVNSMSDLFHDDVPDDFIARVFTVMALAPRHTFQVLTKRPERMLEWFALQGDTPSAFIRESKNGGDLTAVPMPGASTWPLPNVELGVSVEDQPAADKRIRLLLQTPAAVHFLSCEPLLGRVALWPWTADPSTYCLHGSGSEERATSCAPDITGGQRMPSRLDWVIVGGESGPGARPCHVDWVSDIVAQCKAAGVACFVKQLGAHPHVGENDLEAGGGPARRMVLHDRKGGDPDEWPEHLRVRQFPGGGLLHDAGQRTGEQGG